MTNFSNDIVCCSVLQCVVVCCSVLQCAAVRCSVLQCLAECIVTNFSNDICSLITHTSSRKSIFSKYRISSIHISAMAPYISWQELKRFRKRTLYSLKRTLYIRKRTLYIRKRTLYFWNRTPYFCNDALHQLTELKRFRKRTLYFCTSDLYSKGLAVVNIYSMILYIYEVHMCVQTHTYVIGLIRADTQSIWYI